MVGRVENPAKNLARVRTGVRRYLRTRNKGEPRKGRREDPARVLLRREIRAVRKSGSLGV